MKTSKSKSRRAPKRRAKPDPSIFASMSAAQSRQARSIAYKAALAVIG